MRGSIPQTDEEGEKRLMDYADHSLPKPGPMHIWVTWFPPTWGQWYYLGLPFKGRIWNERQKEADGHACAIPDFINIFLNVATQVIC